MGYSVRVSGFFLLAGSIVLSLLCPVSLTSWPTEEPSLEALIVRSELVIVGRVADVSERGNGMVSDLRVQILEVLKGQSNADEIVVPIEGGVFPPRQQLLAKRVLVFGTYRRGSTDLRPVSRRPTADGTPGSAVVTLRAKLDTTARYRTHASSALGKAVAILGEALRESPQEHGLQVRYLLPLTWANRETEVLREIYIDLSSASDSASQLRASEGLIALGLSDGLHILNGQVSSLQEGELLIAMDLLARKYRTADLAGVAILGDWLRSSTSATVRRASASALAHIHSVQAVSILADYVDDPDFDIRWRVIGGMSMFANDISSANMSPGERDWMYRTEETMRNAVFDPAEFRDRETEISSFWKSWWQQNQESIGDYASRLEVTEK